eukprot:maker-scaffold383_size189472-snap-gene-0.28 protein:Tk11344 transcript:maker-scaffold383_size189472-snap-gene-0.28-mRNA-1 annotation:"insulin receptor-2"
MSLQNGSEHQSITVVVVVLLLVQALNIPNTHGEVCGSITLNSTNLSDYIHLENCTVIEGNVGVMIGLETFEPPEEVEVLARLTFPNIQEITDYLLIYRADKLTSLSRLFPNLTVIRGNELLGESALTILQNENLKDIGLKSLTTILRGGVTIKGNPLLCYVHTINWERIVSRAFFGNLEIEDGYESTLCPFECPGRCPQDGREHGKMRLCWNKNHCQKIQLEQCTTEDAHCHLDSQGEVEVCSRNCLGGCSRHSGSNHTLCRSCQDVRTPDGCRSECPQDFLLVITANLIMFPLFVIFCQCQHSVFQYKSYRCISKEDCPNIGNQYVGEVKTTFKDYQGKCLRQCPHNTKEEEGTCITCSDDCPTVCGGAEVTTIQDLEKLNGCTIIKGTLAIQLSGKNVVQKLEEALSKVRIIEGSLKISRVFSLISLDFFTSLEVIEGKDHGQEFSLTLLNNENLRKLFPTNASGQGIQIHKHEGRRVAPGLGFIHYNPHLCRTEIERLLSSAGMNTTSHISDLSNGNKGICDPLELEVNATAQISPFGIPEIMLQFEGFQKKIQEQDLKHDIRGLLGYQVHFKKISLATFQAENLTRYDGRDACLESCSSACPKDIWHINEFQPVESTILAPTVANVSEAQRVNESHSNVSQSSKIELSPKIILQNSSLINSLGNRTQLQLTWPDEILSIKVEPFTYYGVFVTTLLLREYEGTKTIRGAQSKIMYIQAAVYFPTEPRDVHIVGVNHTALNVTWLPPLSPNGEIDHYEVVVELKTKQPHVSTEDCVMNSPSYESPMTSTTTTSAPPLMSSPNETETCDCSGCPVQEEQLVQETISLVGTISQNMFNDLIMNSVFRKTGNTSRNLNRRRRSVDQRESVPTKETTSHPPVPEVLVYDQLGSEPSWQVPEPEYDPETRSYFRVYSTRVHPEATHLLLNPLQHFGDYQVKVRACHKAKLVDNILTKWCSPTVSERPRVPPKPMANDILSSSLRHLPTNGSSSAIITWLPPSDPNGIIERYIVSHKAKMEDDESANSVSCVFPQKFKDSKFRYQLPVEGSYFVSVRAISQSGRGNWTDYIWLEQRSVDWFIVVPSLFAILAFAVLVCIGYLIWRQKQNKNAFSTQNPNYCPMEYIADDWEINRNLVHAGDHIGKGAFAMVYKGTYHHLDQGDIQVAIKMPHEDAGHLECMQFLQEAHLMKEIKTPHVVQLIGVVSVNLPYMVLLEYMALGDLRSFLSSYRPGTEAF